MEAQPQGTAGAQNIFQPVCDAPWIPVIRDYHGKRCASPELLVCPRQQQLGAIGRQSRTALIQQAAGLRHEYYVVITRSRFHGIEEIEEHKVAA
jgi:hypothetical protein